jgi:hypothetical protein
MIEFLHYLGALIFVGFFVFVGMFLLLRYEDEILSFFKTFAHWSKNVGRKRN